MRIRLALVFLTGLFILSAMPPMVYAKKNKPKFPASTRLCDITYDESIRSVKMKYGANGKRTHLSVMTETQTIVDIYNDPKYDANLIINSGDTIPSFVSTVGGTWIRNGRIKGKYFAKKPFATLGDYYGIKLGDKKQKIDKFYGCHPIITKFKKRYITIDVPSPQNLPCVIRFYFDRENRICEIFSGYIP